MNSKTWLWGSRLYGTAGPDSDWDFIVIGDETRQLAIGDINVNSYTDEDFQALVADHDITALECLSQEPEPLTIDLPILRASISAKASHSWVKAKKLLTIENDVYRAQKSLFHSLRILDYGYQLATMNRITCFDDVGYYWEEILKLEPNWETWQTVFKPIYNQLATDFRSRAPLKIN